MKKLTILLITLMAILFACGGTQDNKDNYNDIVIIDTTTDTSNDIPPVSPNPVKLIFYNNDTKDVYFHDGTTDTLWKTGPAASAGNRKIAVDNILYTLDEYGEILLTTDLPATPKIIRIIDSDIWIAEVIPPEVAVTYGWQPKIYTRIYRNDVYIDRYEYEAKKFIVTKSGDIFMQAANDAIHEILIFYPDLYIALENGFIIYNTDYVNRNATIKYNIQESISWDLNYFANSNQKWLPAGDVWYSWNGYVWDETNDLQQLTTSLWDFVLEPWPSPINLPDGIPMMNGFCSYNENGVYKLFWLELRSGLLFKYDTDTNIYSVYTSLYNGTNKTTVEGQERLKNLKPVIYGDYIYYHDGSPNWKSLKKCHLIYPGSSNQVKFGNYEAWRFE